MHAETRYALSTLEAHMLTFKEHHGSLLKSMALEERFEGGQGVSQIDIGKEFSKQRHFPGTARGPVWLELCEPCRIVGDQVREVIRREIM